MLLPCLRLFFFFFFNDTATTEIYTLSLHDALPISSGWRLPAQDPEALAQHLADLAQFDRPDLVHRLEFAQHREDRLGPAQGRLREIPQRLEPIAPAGTIGE